MQPYRNAASVANLVQWLAVTSILPVRLRRSEHVRQIVGVIGFVVIAQVAP